MSTLEDRYANAKAVVTVLDGDDWRWIYVGQNLAYEGHTGMDADLLEKILEIIFPHGDFIVQSHWVDVEYVEALCYAADKLSDLKEKHGYEPDDILVSW